MDFYLMADGITGDFSKAASAADDARETALHWFDELRDPLRRYLIHTGAPQAQADDAIQETLLRLYRHLSNGGSLANPRAWAYRVARNYVRDQRRSARLHLVVSLDDPNQRASQLLDSGGSPENLTLGEERTRRLRAAIERLPPRDREFVSLRSSGLKYREIAAVMEMSLAAVSGLAMRITTRLAEDLS